MVGHGKIRVYNNDENVPTRACAPTRVTDIEATGIGGTIVAPFECAISYVTLFRRHCFVTKKGVLRTNSLALCIFFSSCILHEQLLLVILLRHHNPTIVKNITSVLWSKIQT